MKKILISDSGDLTVAEAQRPILHDNEVEVQLIAIGVNYADVKIRFGYYPDKSKRNPEMGSEMCGIITRTGRDAHRFRVGEKVFAVSHWGGGYAEYIVLPEQDIFRLPLFLSFEQGAAFPVIGQTAFHLVHSAAQVKRGDTVLIHSAGGGVGTMLVQLCKRQGATVIALASRAEKFARIQQLGADYTLDSTKSISEIVMNCTNGAGVNIIFDGNGGANFNDNFQLLSLCGKVILFGNTAGDIPKHNPYELVYSSHQLIGFSMRAITADVARYHQSYTQLFSLLESKQLRIEIGHILPLSDAAKAHDLLQSRQNYGKIVLVNA